MSGVAQVIWLEFSSWLVLLACLGFLLFCCVDSEVGAIMIRVQCHRSPPALRARPPPSVARAWAARSGSAGTAVSVAPCSQVVRKWERFARNPSAAQRTVLLKHTAAAVVYSTGALFAAHSLAPLTVRPPARRGCMRSATDPWIFFCI